MNEKLQKLIFKAKEACPEASDDVIKDAIIEYLTKAGPALHPVHKILSSVQRDLDAAKEHQGRKWFTAAQNSLESSGNKLATVGKRIGSGEAILPELVKRFKNLSQDHKTISRDSWKSPNKGAGRE